MSPVHAQAASLPTPKFTEADLDADQLRRDEAANDAIQPIKTVEQEHPWIWLLYGAAAILTLVLSDMFARATS